MTERPLVSIVIPHLKGKGILFECLQALQRTNYKNKQVIVVDNACTDGSVAAAQQRFPWIHIVSNRENLGYAGGCNSGLAVAQGEFVLFLNDDTTMSDPEWLYRLVQAFESEPTVAACQPKLLSRIHAGEFDYAGAAGGLMDVFGFPFARGRIFFTLEKDRGQYDRQREIFWASGTALMVRQSALKQVGGFDVDFYAHMEEIDLNWRFHLLGYKIVAVPQSVVYHSAGSTLRDDSYLKILLNHRNSLVMLLKNYDWKALLWIFPIRIFLEGAAILYSIVKLDFRRIRAVVAAGVYVSMNLRKILLKRRDVQRIRKVGDREIRKKLYAGSVALDYFVRRKRTVLELGLENGPT